MTPFKTLEVRQNCFLFEMIVPNRTLQVSVRLDPVQVAGHTGEGSGVALLAAGSGSEGGQTDLDLAGLEDQRAARVTAAGGLAAGGGDADVGGGHDRAAVGVGAHGVGDDGQPGPLQVVGHGAGRVADEAPSGGDGGITGIGGVGGSDGWQRDGSDPVAVADGGDLDQGDIVLQVGAVPAGVDDDV